jgi:hypothetical protein
MKWIAVILSGLSALVWLASALVRIPKVYNLVGTHLMPHSDEPQKELALLPPIRLQGKLNAIAAGLMFLATIAQALS